MTRPDRLLTPAVIACLLTSPISVLAADPLESLLPERAASVHIRLNPWGANLGFSSDVDGDDPGVRELIDVIHSLAEPSHDHRCSNVGSIRLQHADGTDVSLGLLPGHTEGYYEFRVFRGGEYVALYRIDRSAFLTALGNLGVPVDHPAFTE